MSTVTGGPRFGIARSGLIMYLDAGKTQSYSGTGNTWFDISDNGRHATLFNSPIYTTTNGGGIVFDGTNDYASFSSTQAYTVQVWAKAATGNAGSLRGIICNSLNGDGSLRFEAGTFRRTNADLNDMQFTYNSDLWINGVKNPNAGGAYYTVPNNRTLEQDFFVSVKTDPTRITSTVSTLSHEFQSGARRFIGTMYIVLLYNRWLSDDEIIRNYNATRNRFGL